MNVIWFANDIPMPDDLSDGFSVEASALELPPDVVPDQILLNGYSYSFDYSYSYDGGPADFLSYKRDHDGARLQILLERQ